MFLGICNYYAKFVPQYAHIATLLYNIPQKKKIRLDYDCDTAFNQLKHVLVHDPILTMPDFDANFVVETNASDMTVGAVLIQHDLPIAFKSKGLNSAQCDNHTTYCELLAIVLACNIWCPYLDGKMIVVLTDNKPLIGVHTAPDLNKI